VSALYGWLTSDEKPNPATKQAHQYLRSKVQTKQGCVEVSLRKNGDYVVTVGPSTMGGRRTTVEVARGNAHDEKASS